MKQETEPKGVTDPMWWESVKELIEYAKSEKPDAYEVLRRANEIAAKWNEQKPPSTNNETMMIYTQPA